MIVWTTLDQFERNLATVPGVLMRAGGEALFIEGNRVMAQAKMLTPVDTGALRNSGFVAPPVYAKGYVQVVLGFGGPATPYAVTVHENLQARHRVGQAKFFEAPFRASVEGWESRVGAYVRSALR